MLFSPTFPSLVNLFILVFPLLYFTNSNFIHQNYIFIFSFVFLSFTISCLFLKKKTLDVVVCGYEFTGVARNIGNIGLFIRIIERK